MPRDKVDFDLVYGIKLVLNRDCDDNAISSFPVTVQYNWPIAAYFSQFNLHDFLFSPKEIFNIVLVGLNLSELTILDKAINIFVTTTGDVVEKFVDDLNSRLGNSLSSPLAYPSSSNRIKELADSITQLYGDGVAYSVFGAYILDSSPINTKNNLVLFFKSLLPVDNGYTLDFEIMKYMLSGIPIRKNITNVNVSEFTIDKIYSCHEAEDGPEIIYVFALSSTKHNIKGIATSISAVENTITF